MYVVHVSYEASYMLYTPDVGVGVGSIRTQMPNDTAVLFHQNLFI